MITNTYLLDWSLQPFAQDYELPSHTTHFAFVNFKHEQRENDTFFIFFRPTSYPLGCHEIFIKKLCWTGMI